LIDDQYELGKNSSSKIVHHAIQISRDTNYHDNSIIFMLWLILSNMKELFLEEGKVNQQNYVTEMLFDTQIRRILLKLGKGNGEIFNEINLLDILINNFDEMIEIFSPKRESEQFPLLDDETVRIYLGVNQFENIWYYSKENFEDLLNWVFTFYGLEIMRNESNNSDTITKLFDQSYKKYLEIFEASKKSEYKLEQLKEKLKGGKAAN